jgi:hypothetical protein
MYALGARRTPSISFCTSTRLFLLSYLYFFQFIYTFLKTIYACLFIYFPFYKPQAQELPKYLRGYHARVGRAEAVELGALLLRAQTHDGRAPPLAHLHHLVPRLVPRDLVRTMRIAEWKKAGFYDFFSYFTLFFDIFTFS